MLISSRKANPVPEIQPEDAGRYARVMALSARISAEKLARRVGSTVEILIDAGQNHRAEGDAEAAAVAQASASANSPRTVRGTAEWS